MPVTRVQVGKADASSHPELVARLADELARDEPTGSGQPSVIEQEFVRTGFIGAKVIWDEFVRVSLTDRPAVIRAAYERARPQDHPRVMFATGYTTREAAEAGLLPYTVEVSNSPGTFSDASAIQRLMAEISVTNYQDEDGWVVIPCRTLDEAVGYRDAILTKLELPKQAVHIHDQANRLRY